MIAKTTRIVQTTATDSSVEISVQPAGTEVGYQQMLLRVIPQDDGCLISVSGLGDRVVGHELCSANHAQLKWVSHEEATQKSQLLQVAKRQLEEKQIEYDRLFKWMRAAMDKPNSFALWVDINRNAGRDPMNLILKGETPDALVPPACRP